MDPWVTGPFLGWLAMKAADKLFDRLVDRALDGPRTWQTPWAGATDTIDITVGNQLRIQARTPVLLTLQEAGDPSGGTIISLMLGDTTRVSLPRGNFVGSAMIVDPQRNTGIPPMLRGFGWSQVRVGQGQSRLVIPTGRPTARLLSDTGLEKPDGTPLFRVPAPRPALGTDVVTSSGIVLPAPLRPKPVRHVPQVGGGSTCRALDEVTGKRCWNPPSASDSQLCIRHRRNLRLRRPVYDHATGKRI